MNAAIVDELSWRERLGLRLQQLAGELDRERSGNHIDSEADVLLSDLSAELWGVAMRLAPDLVHVEVEEAT